MKNVHQEYLQLDRDPVPYPAPPYLNLAKAYRHHRRDVDAEKLLQDGLENLHPDDPYALAMLVDLYLDQNRVKEAIQIYQKIGSAWKHADSDLPALIRLQTRMKPVLENAGQKPWTSTSWKVASHQQLGPDAWRPFKANPFRVTLATGEVADLETYKGDNLLLVFYLGGQCAHCLEQLTLLGKQKQRFQKEGIKILAVSSDSLETCKEFLKDNPNYPLTIASDPSLLAAKKLAAYDEFENLELHATILLDRQGRVWFYDAGSEPFMKVDFLMREIRRMNLWQDKI